ncbi:hypothetical protein PTRA_a3531 [Pseudoalteromonas translucida KMM 520]|uniref:Uncharacterized protein n=1 Tax=Pseudoalteromonas translucida KMM 520 TaxID=1315283 RepID=A0A0U2WRJ1_9GAMM|nr:hypothetical protein PTRA_a3531 [Pseudoalteromonas translucida KMM 520]
MLSSQGIKTTIKIAEILVIVLIPFSPLSNEWAFLFLW